MRYAIYLLLLLASPVFSGEPVYTWRSRDYDPDRIYLYRDGKQIGGWCYRAKYYRPLDGDTWGPPTNASPVQPPELIIPRKSILHDEAVHSVSWSPDGKTLASGSYVGPYNLLSGRRLRAAGYPFDVLVVAGGGTAHEKALQ
jgi:WD40 repeat protein